VPSATAVRILFSGCLGLKCEGISVAKGCWILGLRNSHDKTFTLAPLRLEISMASGFAPGDFSSRLSNRITDD